MTFDGGHLLWITLLGFTTKYHSKRVASHLWRCWHGVNLTIVIWWGPTSGVAWCVFLSHLCKMERICPSGISMTKWIRSLVSHRNILWLDRYGTCTQAMWVLSTMLFLMTNSKLSSSMGTLLKNWTRFVVSCLLSQECFVKDKCDEDGIFVYKHPLLDDIWVWAWLAWLMSPYGEATWLCSSTTYHEV